MEPIQKEPINLQDICCICVQKTEYLKRLIDKDDKQMNYIDKLTNCAPSQKWFTDFKICQACSCKLDEAYNFIQQCIKSEELREQLLKDRVKASVKDEIKVEESENVLTCDLCGKFFKTKATLKVHINKIHCTKDSESDQASDDNDTFVPSESDDDCSDVPLSDFIHENTKSEHEETECKDLIEKKIKRRKKGDNAEAQIKKRRGRRKKIKEELPRKKQKKPKLPVTCEYCQRVYNHRQTYELHVRTNHTFEKPYECDQCPAKFVRNQNLLIHKRSHTNERPYICDTCGKDFTSSGNLSHHSKIHLNRREYKCDLCDKSFNKSGNLSAHKMVVHSDPAEWKFVCQVCGKKFPVKGGLVLHMQRHVGKKEDICHVCKKEFLNKYELKRHMLSHSSDQTFECTVCNEKTFKTKYGLRRHLAFTHHIGKIQYWKAEKKYACHICPKMFTNNSKLKKHLNTHSNENKPYGNVTVQSSQGYGPPGFV